MCDSFPHSVDPRRLVEQRRSLTGQVGLDRLPRLAEIVVQSRADSGRPVAAFELDFGRDAAGRALVRGRVSATLMLRCQRCNDAFPFPVEGQFTLALVTGVDEASRLPEDYDPLLLETDRIDPAALIEDELLLALPAVARHPEGACHPPPFAAADAPGSTAGTEPAREDTPNPFAVLEQLKRPH